MDKTKIIERVLDPGTVISVDGVPFVLQHVTSLRSTIEHFDKIADKHKLSKGRVIVSGIDFNVMDE